MYVVFLSLIHRSDVLFIEYGFQIIYFSLQFPVSVLKMNYPLRCGLKLRIDGCVTVQKMRST